MKESSTTRFSDKVFQSERSKRVEEGVMELNCSFFPYFLIWVLGSLSGIRDPGTGTFLSPS